jgi:hypothetical protein
VALESSGSDDGDFDFQNRIRLDFLRTCFGGAVSGALIENWSGSGRLDFDRKSLVRRVVGLCVGLTGTGVSSGVGGK